LNPRDPCGSQALQKIMSPGLSFAYERICSLPGFPLLALGDPGVCYEDKLFEPFFSFLRLGLCIRFFLRVFSCCRMFLLLLWLVVFRLFLILQLFVVDHFLPNAVVLALLLVILFSYLQLLVDWKVLFQISYPSQVRIENLF